MSLPLLIALALPLSANASPVRYYYSVAETETPGWNYVLPACQKLPAAEFEKIQHECKTLGTAGQKCATEKTVTLKRVAKAEAAPAAEGSATPPPVPVTATDKDVQKVDDTTKTFKLSSVVFENEKACRSSREEALKREH